MSINHHGTMDSPVKELDLDREVESQESSQVLIESLVEINKKRKAIRAKLENSHFQDRQDRLKSHIEFYKVEIELTKKQLAGIDSGNENIIAQLEQIQSGSSSPFSRLNLNRPMLEEALKIKKRLLAEAEKSLCKLT